MSSTALANPSVAISIRAARLAMAAIATYQVLLIVLILLRPDLDPSWHTMSEWAIGPHGWIMSAALLISALSYAALLLSLARNSEAWWSARRVLLWTAGLPLFGFLSFAVYSAIFVFPLGSEAYGPGVNIGWPPRFAFLTYMLWVVTLGWQAIRCSRKASTEIQGRV